MSQEALGENLPAGRSSLTQSGAVKVKLAANDIVELIHSDDGIESS